MDGEAGGCRRHPRRARDGMRNATEYARPSDAESRNPLSRHSARNRAPGLNGIFRPRPVELRVNSLDALQCEAMPSMIPDILRRCGLLLAPLVWLNPAQAALERVDDFALLDQRGEFHQLSRYRHMRALAVMAYSADCPAMTGMSVDFESFAGQFGARGIAFLFIDPHGLGREELRGVELELPILDDAGQLASAALELEQAGEVALLNPERLSLFYRGAADAGFERALQALLADGIDDSIRAPLSTDCPLAYPSRDAMLAEPPDYATEVAPLIIENCGMCHRRGGVGPFALDSYLMLLGWSPMIREVLLNKRMPPMQVDAHIGYSRDARYIETEDLQVLINWIDAGAPGEIGAQDPLQALANAPGREWELGEPDYIAQAPRQDIPPTGVLDYTYQEVDPDFTGKKWVRALQYLPGDESVLHHLMIFVTGEGEDFWGAERRQENSSRGFLDGYAPGQDLLREFAPGTGVPIGPGEKLSMQFHYVTNGQSTSDITRIGLYFADEPPERELITQAVSTRFLLPANVADFPLQASHRLERQAVLVGVRARMNYRGKKMKFAYRAPGGPLREIFSVPAYNYGWQPNYRLEQPIELPAGTILYVIGAFDNSISNPNNPNPDSELSFGVESWEEMFTGYFTYHHAD